MLSRVLWSGAFATSAFFAFASEAFAATDKVKVGFGTFFVALGVMGICFIAFLVKYYFGLAGVAPPPDTDPAHAYPSLPPNGGGHGDAHGASHH